MRKRLYMDIHVLQAVPASCINRDDAGSPKEMVYGGTIRGRVSSQSWKNAMRTYFSDIGEDVGIRTRKIKDKLVEKLIENEIEPEIAEEFAGTALKDSNLTTSADDKKQALVFLSETQINNLSEVILRKLKESDDYDDKEYKFDLKKAVSDNPTSDMILFGRMMANDASLNYDAAAQVAHTFTVNESREEYDYFTAVDDLSGDEAGAAHLDSKSYNSGVYYRYANVNLSEDSELIRMDKDNAAKSARNFAEAFICSMPSGSSNSYANRTVPDVVIINLRQNMPISYAPAFLKAIDGEDYLTEATARLDEYEAEVNRKYREPSLTLTFKNMSLDEILNKLETAIQEVL